MLRSVLIVLMGLGALVSAQVELKATDFNCANSKVRLACDPGTAVFVSRVVHKHSPTQCVEYDANMNLVHKFKPQAPLDHCLGIDFHDDRMLKECNGKESCDVEIHKKSHLIGFYGTNCDFQSNIAKIFYTCVPNTLRNSIKAFDICEKNGPEIILGLTSGFIHSPNFPDYYGNNRHCEVKIGVPAGQRLVLFLISMSMEGLSILDGKANDYLLVDNDKELSGKLDMPYILYNASDRESVQLKFKSDWITTTRLASPKGFLIYFALTDAYLTTTTVPPTTTEPMTITESLISDNNGTTEDSDSAYDFEAAHIKRNDNLDLLRERQGDNVVTIISVLVGLIGVLILVIFGLLLLFRNKPKKTNEDDQIYDTVSDEKSMSNIYGCGSEYNASNSFNSSAGSGELNKSIDEDKQKLNEGTMPRGSKQASKIQESKFSLRLKKFYSNLGQTLHLSSKILADANGGGASVALNNNCVKSSLDADKNASSLDESKAANLKMFSINEFNPNDVDIKYEKDIAIDTLKLCKTPSSANSTLRKAISMYKNNLEHQHHQQQRANMMGGDQEALNRSENVYVSNPIADNSSSNEDDLGQHQAQNRLQIYEVNFDNNYAYITPAAVGSTNNKSSATDLNKNAASAKPVVDNVAEIYQTINEMDDDDDGEDDQVSDDRREAKPYQSGKPADSQSIDDFSSIYQTPSNKRILSSTLQGSAAVVPDEEPAINGNTSVIHLLNEENENENNNDETLA